MARTHVMDLDRDDETSVCLEYTISAYDPGVSSGPAEICYPPEGGEVEIIRVTDAGGNELKTTDEEDARWITHIQEHHDFDDGYDDWDDCRDDR